MSRCDCCDLPTDLCGKAAEKAALDEEKAVRARALDEPGVIEAKRNGVCPACKSKIRIGDPIRKSFDGWVGAICCPAELRAN